MYEITIVEDEKSQRKRLTQMIEQYAAESGIEFHIRVHSNGNAFLEHQEHPCDILLLDIQMPGADGLEVARQIRRWNDRIIIIFITNLIQYAIRGYEVDAMDFVAKPVSYEAFRIRMQKAVKRLAGMEKRYISVNSGGMVRIAVSDILYAEIVNRKLMIHTISQGVIGCYETMQSLEEKVQDRYFVRSHAAVLINLRYVKRVLSDAVLVNEEPVMLSKRRHREFLRAFMDYMGEQL